MRTSVSYMALLRPADLVKLECLEVTLQSFLVIAVGFVDDAIYMPAYVRVDVKGDAGLDELDTLFFPVQIGQY